MDFQTAKSREDKKLQEKDKEICYSPFFSVCNRMNHTYLDCKKKVGG